MSVKLKWIASGDIDSFKIYRKDSYFDASNLPAVLATISGHEYIDTTPLSNTNYYRVESNAGALKKLSSIVQVSIAPPVGDELLLNMPFSEDINDHGKFGLIATAHGTILPSIQDNSLYIASGSYIKLTPTQAEFNIGSADFEFCFDVQMQSSGNSSFPCLFGVGNAWSSGAVSMQFNPGKHFMAAFMNPGERDAFSPSSQAFDNTTWVKYIIRRISGVVTTYKDGIAGASLVDNMSINFAKNNVITIGAALWSIGVTSSHSRIKNLYLKKLD